VRFRIRVEEDYAATRLAIAMDVHGQRGEAPNHAQPRYRIESERAFALTRAKRHGNPNAGLVNQ